MPAAPPIIAARDVAKAYRIWRSQSARARGAVLGSVASALPRASRVRAALARAAAAGYRDFHAVHPLSFEIRRGEAVGIIGRNGSGKSTLLQLIAGILQPTAGGITTQGRISALLELGSGFNPEFTGRENVYLNGSILGLGAREMDRLIDPIIAFADIGEFIDEPVKTYSSGMMMRLAFAVAVSVQPDILIVDEALSVGDVFFTQKCFNRIREILAAGATLIFVSHDTAAVQNLCSRGLLLHQGRLLHDGTPEECVTRYFALVPRKPAPAAAAPAAGRPAVDPALRAAVLQHDLVGRAKSRHGDRQLEIVAASFRGPLDTPDQEVPLGGRATIRLLVRANRPVAHPAVGIQLFDRMGNLIFSAGTPQLKFSLPALAAGEEILLDFRLGFDVQPGEYTLGLDAAETGEDGPNIGYFQDRITGVGPVAVTFEPHAPFPFFGAARLPLDISYA
ncbi:MAG TPA: ABC transporter ATP-binding protein [Lacunisphaera sp.]|nr:ABC transporter ATP-binding protein [Lacunisphaera sp.]